MLVPASRSACNHLSCRAACGATRLCTRLCAWQGLADGLPKEDALSHLGARLQAWISAVDTAVAKDPAAPLHTVMPEGGELGLAVAEVSSLLGDRQDLAMPILQRILQRMLEVSGFRCHPAQRLLCWQRHVLRLP